MKSFFIDIEEIPTHSKHHLEIFNKVISDTDVKFIDDEINTRLHPSVSDKKKKKYDTGIKKNNSESVPMPSNHNNDSHGTSQSLQSIEMNPTRAPCMKAKLLRKQRKQHKLMTQGKTQEEIEAIFKENKQENQAKSIEQLFDEICKGTNRLEVGCTSISSSTLLNVAHKWFSLRLVLFSPIYLIYKISRNIKSNQTTILTTYCTLVNILFHTFLFHSTIGFSYNNSL